MEPSEPSRKTRAIMFSDIKGYSALMGENEPLALKLLEEHNLICVPLIKRHGGAVLKFIGDAILSAFESATDAVQAGLELQRLLAERNASRPDIVPLVIRIGIHIGDVVFKDGDVFGDGVNIAARIEPLAEPGGIAISQTVYDMIKARPEIQTVSLGAKELKNIKEAVNIYKVLVGASEEPPPTADWALMAKALIAFMIVATGVTIYVNRRSAPQSAATGVFAQPPPPAAPAAPDPMKKVFDRNNPRVKERDDDFWMFRPKLVDKNVPEAEKQRLTLDFYNRYHLDPGLNPGYAWELALYLPPGSAKADATALAESPVGREAAARVRLKAAVMSRIDDALKIPPGVQRKAFNADCPINTNGWIVEVRPGEPAFDSQGRATFKFRPKPGVERSIIISGDVLKVGSDAEPAIARAAQDIAADYLSVKR